MCSGSSEQATSLEYYKTCPPRAKSRKGRIDLTKVTALVEGFNGQFLIITPSRAWDLHVEMPLKASDPSGIEKMYEESQAWLAFLSEHTSVHVAGNRASPSGFSLCVSRRKTIGLIKSAGGMLPGGGGAADSAAAAGRRRSAQVLEELEEEEADDAFGGSDPFTLQSSTRVASTATAGRYTRPSAVIRQQASNDALDESMSEAGLDFEWSDDDSESSATKAVAPSDAVRDEAPPPPGEAPPESIHVVAAPPLARPVSAPTSSHRDGAAPHNRAASAPAPPRSARHRANTPAPPRSARPQSQHAVATPPPPAVKAAPDFLL